MGDWRWLFCLERHLGRSPGNGVEHGLKRAESGSENGAESETESGAEEEKENGQKLG